MVKHWGGSLYHKAATRVMARVRSALCATLGQHNRPGSALPQKSKRSYSAVGIFI